MMLQESLPDEAAEFPCSQAQLRVWLEDQVAPGNPALHVVARWRVDAQLPASVVETAWRAIVARHAVLRTAIRNVDGQPVQVVESRTECSIAEFDLRPLSERDRARVADEVVARESATRFDLSCPPLARLTRLAISDTTAILLLVAHQMVCDRRAIGLIGEELRRRCSALVAGTVPELPEAGTAYGMLAAREHLDLTSRPSEPALAVVHDALRGAKPFELLTDHPRPPRLSSNGATSTLLLDDASSEALHTLARHNGDEILATALAALFVLLQRYSGESDILLGLQLSARDRAGPEPVVGNLVNTSVLRLDLAQISSFATAVDRVRALLFENAIQRELSFAQLIEVAQPVRDPSRNALFSVCFGFESASGAERAGRGIAFAELPPVCPGVLYDLSFSLVQGPEGWRLACDYNTDLYEPTTIAGLLERFCALLRAAAADPALALGDLEILSAAERHALIIGENDTAAAYPRDVTLTQLVAAQIAATPNAPAVICAGRRLTYGQLGVGIGQLAARIIARGCRPGARVGILLDRSADMVVAMLAVLRAGCAYVPLDPAYPVERLAFIVADAELSLTVTSTRLAERAELTGRAALLIDVGAHEDDLLAAGAARVATSADDVAYVIYTSGSTGKPKGVQIQQRALINFLWAMRARPGFTANDVLVAVTTISFDIAGLEVFLPLITGATLVVATEREVVDGRALLQLIRQSAATIVQATPVTWQMLIDAGWSGTPRIRMLCGGEALSRQLADALLERGELWNMYGPTETTIWSSAVRVEPGTGPVLIGPPIGNTQFYVLDARRRLVPPGVCGELYIGGDGVALGYFNRAELTRERFVPDPFRDAPAATLYRTGDLVRRRECGKFEFLGRTDHQIKLRGFRIELDEIVSALLRQAGVADATAVVGHDPAGQASIRAFVVPGPDAARPAASWPDELRTALSRSLPKYMLPASIGVLERLPRTPNGKLDRAALPLDVAVARHDIEELPQTPTEAMVASLAGELLGRAAIGRNVDLFGLGLHSLLAVRLIARIAQRSGVDVPVQTVFEAATIAGIAAVLDQAGGRSSASAPVAAAPIVVYNRGGAAPPFVYFHNDDVAQGMHCRRLAEAIGPDQPLVAIAPYGSAGLPILTTIQAMALDALERLTAVQPAGPYRLGGFCSGSYVALELARLLHARGDVVERVVVINAYAPLHFMLPGADALVRRIGLDVTRDSIVREKLCLNIGRLSLAIDRGPAAVARFLAARFWTLRRLRERERQYALANPFLPQQMRGTHQTEAGMARIVADLTYHPKPYDGGVTLIWSAAEEAPMGDPMRGDSTRGWGALAARVTVEPIGGSHYSPIQERVGELGALLTGVFAA